MSRNERSDWAVCPHCRSFAEQTVLFAQERRMDVRWSTCMRCRQTAIWEGSVTVFPARQRQAV